MTAANLPSVCACSGPLLVLLFLSRRHPKRLGDRYVYCCCLSPSQWQSPWSQRRHSSRCHCELVEGTARAVAPTASLHHPHHRLATADRTVRTQHTTHAPCSLHTYIHRPQTDTTLCCQTPACDRGWWQVAWARYDPASARSPGSSCAWPSSCGGVSDSNGPHSRTP